MTTEEMKQEKARGLRYKKPIARHLNLESIKDDLCEISEACDDVLWFVENDEDTLVNALDGDEDEAHEFKMMFSDLAAECERMHEDLHDWLAPSDCFDIFFACVEGRNLLGYDAYEGDYFGLDHFESQLANEEATKQLKRMTKDEIIGASRWCFRVYQAYIGLRYRYDCIKAAMDILRNENTGQLQVVRRIQEIYKEAEAESSGFRYSGGTAYKELESLLDKLPPEAWVQ